MGGNAPKATTIAGLCGVDIVGAPVQVFVHTTSTFQPGGADKRERSAGTKYVSTTKSSKQTSAQVYFLLWVVSKGTNGGL